jgi:hypothetical protein
MTKHGIYELAPVFNDKRSFDLYVIPAEAGIHVFDLSGFPLPRE